jgi:ribosomal protein S18 acetylase RimI-like enzyme
MPSCKAHVDIQLAGAKHIKTISQLHREFFPHDPNFPRAQNIAKMVSSQSALFMVGFIERDFAGYGLIRNWPFRPWTSGDALAVMPDYRRHGVASAILDFALQKAARPMFRLFVRADNAMAIKLYRSRQFIVVGRRREHYEDGEDALIMMRWI